MKTGVVPHLSSPVRRNLRKIAIRVPLLAALVLGLYGVVVLYMVTIENRLVYFPARPDQEWVDKPDPCIQDVTLHTADGALHAWYCPADRPDAVFLLCHGNAGNLSTRGESLLEYRKRFNASIFIFDYPGYGLSEGDPSEQGCYAAADAAYEWLVKQKGFKPDKIVVCGESLGGGVAVDLASRQPCSALVLVHTFANLPSVAQRLYRWLPVELLMTNRFASEDKIGKVRVPVFVAHGDHDDIIPSEQSRHLFEKAASEAKEYLLRKGKGHFDKLEAPELDRLKQFLVRQGTLPKK